MLLVQPRASELYQHLFPICVLNMLLVYQGIKWAILILLRSPYYILLSIFLVFASNLNSRTNHRVNDGEAQLFDTICHCFRKMSQHLDLLLASRLKPGWFRGASLAGADFFESGPFELKKPLQAEPELQDCSARRCLQPASNPLKIHDSNIFKAIQFGNFFKLIFCFCFFSAFSNARSECKFQTLMQIPKSMCSHGKSDFACFRIRNRLVRELGDNRPSST